MKNGQINGKRGRMTAVSSLGKLPAEWVVVVGLGRKKELNRDAVRGVAAEAGRLLNKKKVKKVAVGLLGTTEAEIDAAGAIQAIIEGALLGTYAFRKHKTKKEDNAEIEELLVIAADDLPVLKRAARRGEIIARATNLARDMANEPANFMPLSWLRHITLISSCWRRIKCRNWVWGPYWGLARAVASRPSSSSFVTKALKPPRLTWPL
jgi:leucyl aminopeptidase